MGLKRTSRALVFALTLVAVVVVTRAEDDPILILISFDGFRWDYDSRFPAPNLHALARRGVRAKEMIPSFPVLTFPNHYTIVTGLYPEHHGVVANNIVEPGYPVKFTMSNEEAVRDGRWWGGEPLWVTAERQGRRSAAMFWPGTEAEIRGVRPSYYRAFDGKLPAASRTAQVLEWLALPKAGVHRLSPCISTTWIMRDTITDPIRSKCEEPSQRSIVNSALWSPACGGLDLTHRRR